MRLSVIITTYNRARLLPQTVESVLAQTRPADEILIVDDGSTDTTPAVAASFAGRGVRSLRQENGGPSAARNMGFTETTGDALLFLDDDDLLLPDALANLESALTRHPDALLAYGQAQIVDENGKLQSELWRVGNEATRDLLWEALARMNFIRSTGCVLLRRAALVQNGLWEESLRHCEDWDFWLRLAEVPDACFSRVPQPTLAYRIHGGNVSGSERRMYDATRLLYLRHRDRHAPDSGRYRYMARLLDEFPPLTNADDAPPVRSAERLSLRHRILRGLIEGTGIAPLYRRLPIGVRLRLRALFGIGRWAV